MAVTITSPQSQVVQRRTITISWTPEYPQSAYEILWRRKGDSAWNTFGQVTSNATSATLDLSNFTDFLEYHYAVVTYSNDATSGGSTYNGNDHSAGYSIIIVPGQFSGYLKIGNTTGMVEVPFYNQDSSARPVVKTSNSNTIGVVPLNEANATNAHIRVGSETKALAKDTAAFAHTGQYAYAYMHIVGYENVQYNGYYMSGSGYYITGSGYYRYSASGSYRYKYYGGMTYYSVYRGTYKERYYYYRGVTTVYAYRYVRYYTWGQRAYYGYRSQSYNYYGYRSYNTYAAYTSYALYYGYYQRYQDVTKYV